MFCDLSRRKASVDENYEWDAADIYSQPGDHDGEDILFSLFIFGPNTGYKKNGKFVC